MTREIFLLLFATTNRLMAQTDIKVGLVTDSVAYPKATDVLNTGINDARKSGRMFNLGASSRPTNGCNGGIQGAGTFALVDDYINKNISAVFGPTCFKDLQMSSRLTFQWNIMQFNFWNDHPSDTLDNTVVQMTTRSSVNVAANLVAALTILGWDKIVIFSCAACYGDPTQGNVRISYVIHYLETNGIEVLRQRYFLPGDTAEAISAQLNETRTRGRIFLPLGGPDIAMYEQFMRAVQMADLPSYDYAVVLVLNSYNVNGLSMPWKANPELLRYYSNAIIIYNDCYNSEAARNFASKIGVSTDNADQLALYMTLYETIFFYNNLIEAQKFVLDSRGLLNFVRNQLFIGPFANYTLNEVTNRITPFRVVYIKSKSGDPMDLASIALHTSQCPADANKQCVQLVAHLLDTGNTTIELPLDMPVCGFEGELCEQTSTVLVIIGIVAGLALLSILFFIYRRVKGNEIRDMPWSLPVSHVQFIETNKNGETTRNQDNSFQSLQLLQELGPPPGTATGNRDDVQKRSAERGRPRLIPLPPKTRLATITNNFACVYTYPFIEKRSNFNRDEIQLFYQVKTNINMNLLI